MYVPPRVIEMLDRHGMCQDGEPTVQTMMFLRDEYRTAIRNGIEEVSGYEVRDENGDVVDEVEFNNTCWRVAGCPSREEHDLIGQQITGSFIQAFPYLFFTHQSDAVWWRLRQNW